MASKFTVPSDKLTWRCDLSFLPFTCTADMTPLEDFIGQERAIRAIEFGLGVDKPGFNIFVTGLTGTGKTSIIKAFLKKNNRRTQPSGTRDGRSRGLVLCLQLQRSRPASRTEDPPRMGQSPQDGYGAVDSKFAA